jgi:hypothetical protein
MRKLAIGLLALALGGCATGPALQDKAVSLEAISTQAAASGDWSAAGSLAARANYIRQTSNARLQQDSARDAKQEIRQQATRGSTKM